MASLTNTFIDRREENMAAKEPSRITPKRKKRNKKSENSPEASSSVSSSDNAEPPKTPGRERSELNIEIKGYKESSLTPKSRITSDKVRTVFRSSGGSSSDSKESSPAVSSAVNDDDVFCSDVSHRTPTEVVDGGVWYLHRKTSESHYISQQYNVDATTDSPSKSVTAIPHVTFMSRKALSIGSNTSSTSSADGDQHIQSPEQIEKNSAGSDSPGFMHSPSASSATSQFLFDSLEDGTRGSTLSDGKLDSAKEDVQQIIQSSYMVSDISDVIDDDEMKADSKQTKSSPPLSPESSVDAFEKKSKSKGKNKSSNLALDPKTRESSASISAYSPGLAMRSYALEELQEKKSCQKTPLDAKSMRYDSNSSKIDIDSGSSVDNVDASTEDTSSSPFKITRVNKVHLPEHTTASAPSMTEEERRESEDRLDNLVDINAIQAGYRFHDVGMMMMDVGGICNPAFDDSEEDDPPTTNPDISYSSSENMSSTKPDVTQNEIIAPVLSSSSSSALSSAPSLVMKSPNKQTPNVERNLKDKEVTEQKLPTSRENAMVNDVSFLLNDASLQKNKQKPKPVPFTRKFNPTKKFESNLKSLGARLLSESLIIDVYYDTEAFDLTLNDSWLRTRNGKWQFHAGFTTLFGNQEAKSNSNNDDNNKNDANNKSKNDNKKNKNRKKKKNNENRSKTPSQSSASYQELEDVGDLISNVHAAINTLPKDFLKKGNFSSIAAFAHRSGLREYVRYTNTQKCYELDDMTIDLDMPQHGYWSGSVTTRASSKASVHKGVQAMDSFWNKTGVKPLSMMCA